MSSGVGHSPSATRGTETAILTRKGQYAALAAGFAPETQEAEFCDSAFQVRSKFFFDE
jgi:hypothetical protein